MPTTIQINEKTLHLLRRLKQEFDASSYDEAITRIATQRMQGQSMAGSLKKYVKRGETLKDLLAGLRDKRDRF